MPNPFDPFGMADLGFAQASRGLADTVLAFIKRIRDLSLVGPRQRRHRHAGLSEQASALEGAARPQRGSRARLLKDQRDGAAAAAVRPEIGLEGTDPGYVRGGVDGAATAEHALGLGQTHLGLEQIEGAEADRARGLSEQASALEGAARPQRGSRARRLIRSPLDESEDRISKPARRLSEAQIRHPEGIKRLYALQAVMNGRGDAILDLAKTNLLR
jgi:hypothetical protein